VNAVRIFSEIASMVPGEVLPVNTEGREGYLHPNHITGDVEEATLKMLVRDFTMEGMGVKVNILENIAELQRAKYPSAQIDLDVQESYRNMRYVLEKEPLAMGIAIEALSRADVPLKKAIVRGGTDGSRLSFMGLPTPNIFAGGMNFHSRKEYIPLASMEASVRTIIELARVCATRT
jgi:tripeptide aminopeptidase